MREAEGCDRLGDVLGLVRVEEVGPPGRDVAEGAGAGADPPQYHHGGVLLFPALADIRASRLFAHRVEPKLAHQPPGCLVFGRSGRPDAQPVGLTRDRTIGAMGLFGMARGR